MRQVTVKWVYPERLLEPNEVFDAETLAKAGRIPVVELSALRAWLEHEWEQSIKNGEEGYVSILGLLAQLRQEGSFKGTPHGAEREAMTNEERVGTIIQTICNQHAVGIPDWIAKQFIEQFTIALEQAAQPVWSREEPKGEGWYQYKDLDDTEEGRQVCRVSVINGRMLALFFDGDSAELESLNGEWATIPLPREA